jgi:hypothetical protein
VNATTRATDLPHHEGRRPGHPWPSRRLRHAQRRGALVQEIGVAVHGVAAGLTVAADSGGPRDKPRRTVVTLAHIDQTSWPERLAVPLPAVRRRKGTSPAAKTHRIMPSASPPKLNATPLADMRPIPSIPLHSTRATPLAELRDRASSRRTVSGRTISRPLNNRDGRQALSLTGFRILHPAESMISTESAEHAALTGTTLRVGYRTPHSAGRQ